MSKRSFAGGQHYRGAKIRRMEEIISNVSAGLPWKLPSSRVKDLLTYATIRMNARRASSNSTVVAPRIAFTGRKINYSKKYKLSFGTYSECYDSKVVCRDAERDHTEPCIALYPAVNAYDSWVFLNMETNKYVRRSDWVSMVTRNLVITRMQWMKMVKMQVQHLWQRKTTGHNR
jgi:hypothetical protein